MVIGKTAFEAEVWQIISSPSEASNPRTTSSSISHDPKILFFQMEDGGNCLLRLKRDSQNIGLQKTTKQ